MDEPDTEGGQGRQSQPLHTHGQRVQLTDDKLVMRRFGRVVDQMGGGDRQEEDESHHSTRREQAPGNLSLAKIQGCLAHDFPIIEKFLPVALYPFRRPLSRHAANARPHQSFTSPPILRDSPSGRPASPSRRGARHGHRGRQPECPGGDEWQVKRLLERPPMGVVGLITGDELQQDCAALFIHPSSALDRRDDIVRLLNPLRVSAQGTA